MKNQLKNLNDNYINYGEQSEFWGRTYESVSQEEKERISKILRIIPDDVSSILDIGCGDGLITNILNEKYDVTGVDLSNEALKYVKAKKINCSSSDLPFDDKSFDLIILTDVIEHLPLNVYKKTLEEILRVSKSYILINTPNKENIIYKQVICNECQTVFHNCGHLRVFNEKIFNEIADENNLDIKKLDYAGILKDGIVPAFLWKIVMASGFFTYVKTSLCPSCGNNNIEKPKITILTFILLRLLSIINIILKPLKFIMDKKDNYKPEIIVLFEKKK